MLCVGNEFQKIFTQLGLISCEAVSGFFLKGSEHDKAVFIQPAILQLDGGAALPVFFKQYSYKPASWRFIGRASKARREFQNYAVFSRLGIACGQERDALGRLRYAFIITREIPNAKTLPEFFKNQSLNRTNTTTRNFRKRLLEQLAEITHRLHAAGFFHNDLVWRNILVTQDSADEARLWLIDCPRGKFDRWSPLRHHRRLKDLASLDKVATQLSTRSERLLFLKSYLAKSRADLETKKLAGQILAYRKNRWPED